MSLLDTVDSFDAYLARGGGRGLAAARVLGSEATLRELAHSGLRGRGRGGGGIATAHTWRAVRDAAPLRRRVVANGTDVEPASFKDRALLRANPYQLLEGLAIAALTVGVDRAFIAVRGSFTVEIERVRDAIEEMSRAGALGDVSVAVVPGPEEYVFGEEGALLEVIDGNDPYPRIAPRTDVVDDVETLAHVTTILARGSAWFRARGTARSPGTMVFTICGDVQHPGVHEVALGAPLRSLVEEHGGGTASGRPVKLVCGGAKAVVPGSRLDIALDDDAFALVGATLGTGGFAVYGDDVCALALARAFSNFLWVESCGQCPGCKLGSGAITTALALLERRGDGEQFAVLQRSLATVSDGSRCGLPDDERTIVGGLLRAFPEDVVAHEERRCTLRHDVIVPAIVQLVDGVAEYDLRLTGKRPDWTYVPAPPQGSTAVQVSTPVVS